MTAGTDEHEGLGDAVRLAAPGCSTWAVEASVRIYLQQLRRDAGTVALLAAYAVELDDVMDRSVAWRAL